MAKSKKQDETEAQQADPGSYSESQAEEDGWIIALEQEPTVVSATGTGANTEVVVRTGKFVAEKTYDDHLITAVGETKDQLLEAIRYQQASIDSAPAQSAAVASLPGVSDRAGGEDGGGMGEALPETQVQRDEQGAVEEVSA